MASAFRKRPELYEAHPLEKIQSYVERMAVLTVFSLRLDKKKFRPTVKDGYLMTEYKMATGLEVSNEFLNAHTRFDIVDTNHGLYISKFGCLGSY